MSEVQVVQYRSQSESVAFSSSLNFGTPLLDNSSADFELVRIATVTLDAPSQWFVYSEGENNKTVWPSKSPQHLYVSTMAA